MLLSTGSKVSYEWQIGDVMLTGSSVSHVFDESGSYDIVLNASNALTSERVSHGIVIVQALSSVNVRKPLKTILLLENLFLLTLHLTLQLTLTRDRYGDDLYLDDEDGSLNITFTALVSGAPPGPLTYECVRLSNSPLVSNPPKDNNF